jgi:hypothetical protein
MKQSNIPANQNPFHNRVIMQWWICDKNQSFDLCRASLTRFTVFNHRSVSVIGCVNSLVLQKEFSVDKTAHMEKE